MEFVQHQQPKTTAIRMYTVIIASLLLNVICLLKADAPSLPTNQSRPGTVAVDATLTNQTDLKDLENYTTTQGNEISFSITSSKFQQSLKKSTYERITNLSSSAKSDEEITEQRPSHGIHSRTFVIENRGLNLVGFGNSTQKSATPISDDLVGENSWVSNDLLLQEKSSHKHKEKVYDVSTSEFKTKPHLNLVASSPLLHLQNEFDKALLENGTSENDSDNDDAVKLEVSPQLPLNKSISENDYGVATSLNGSSSRYGQVEEVFAPSGDNDNDMTLTFTCEGRCGTNISFPCSCSATCVVYGTCCENLSQDCPRVWQEGQNRFDHIRGSDFVCDADLKIYKIVSCPRSVDHKEIGSSNAERPSTAVSTTPETKGITLSNSTSLINADEQLQEPIWQRLIKALTAVPLTDSRTGFTFTSKAIYDCLNMPSQTAMPWSLKVDYKTISPTKLEDVDNFQTLEEYYPNFDKNILTAHLCVPDIIDTCKLNADLEKLRDIDEDNCKNSTAIVVSRSLRINPYRNRFCAYCNEGRHNRYKLLKRNKVFVKEANFFVLMSLSERNTLSFNLITSASFARAPFPWSKVECPVPDRISSSTEHNESWRASESEKTSICSVTCGHPSFTIRSDGICRAQHTALLAVADDGLAPLCPSAVMSMARFLACGLEKEIKSLRVADISASSVEVMFDSAYNNKLYVVKLSMALAEGYEFFFSNSREDIISNIQHVALLAKSFKDYRHSQNPCPQTEDEIQNDYSKTIHTSSLVLTMARLVRDLDYLKKVEQLRGQIVDNQTTTTVCLSTIFPTSEVGDIDPNELKCMDDPVYERDAVWITKFLDSPCFSHFENVWPPGTNGAIDITKDSGIQLDGVFFLIVVEGFVTKLLTFE
ncbi:hypothetical protein PoB_001003600 [Plakobranchus ocellatus]|uniref:SMB domain-containing protein n=1 Tax=Plakobranchus ocellatus TaxID=259542 RepID=A0AAV3YMA1_9GAST|nr:hypothetical protein PoB_001003600 [Plakobranchus ocellatus]